MLHEWVIVALDCSEDPGVFSTKAVAALASYSRLFWHVAGHFIPREGPTLYVLLGQE